MTDEPQNNSGGDLVPGTIFAKRFQVLSRVAAGGMGVVYRVKDTALGGEEVALKLLHPQYSENKVVLKRFLNEVRVARALSHPHIVRIHDFGTAENGQAFITMEYVSGQSLSKLISTIFPEEGSDQQFRLSEKTLNSLILVFQQTLEAIAYAHKRGIIHRDLKPANILIGDNGEVKVADFGTARILGNSSTITVEGQSSLGTPQYMSPEQVRGDELDKACDIYALGMLGYELVVGHPPFYGIAPLSVMYKQLNELIPPFADESRGIPIWWQSLILKATEKEKSARYHEVENMLEIIGEHTGNARSYVANPQTIEGLRIYVKQKTPPLVWVAIAIVVATIIAFLTMRESKEEPTISIPYLPPAVTTLAVPTILPPTAEPSTRATVRPEPQIVQVPNASIEQQQPQATKPTQALPKVDTYIPDRTISRADYQGSFARAISGDTSAPDKSMSLLLVFTNDAVTGKAIFDGHENYQVAGTRNSQGVQLTLKSSSKIIQLSGAFRTGGYLRGSYFVPLSNSRGTWTVKSN